MFWKTSLCQETKEIANRSLGRYETSVFIILIVSLYESGASLVAQLIKNPSAMQEIWLCELIGKTKRSRQRIWTVSRRGYLIDKHGKMFNLRSNQRNADNTSYCSQVALVVKNPPANAGDLRDSFSPWVRRIPWRGAWQPTPGFLPGGSHGQRSLAEYKSRGSQRVRHN